MFVPLITNPENLIIHTRLVYFDGKFSENYNIEDTNTATYFLNESNENVYVKAYEYDRNRKEVAYDITIGPNQNQFIKTEGPGVVIFTNSSRTSSSTVIFTNNPPVKKYYPKTWSQQ